jgi:hypothetical protein
MTNEKSQAKTKENDDGKSGGRTRVAWLTLSEEQLNRPGGQLLAALFQRANLRGHQLAEMARELHVTYGYISQLRKHSRHVPRITQRFVQACANYLGIRPILVKILAEQVVADDFVEPTDATGALLDAAIQYIRADGGYGTFIPTEVTTASRTMKLFIIDCYREATGIDLTPAASPSKKLRDVMEAMLVFEEHRSANLALDEASAQQITTDIIRSVREKI